MLCINGSDLFTKKRVTKNSHAWLNSSDDRDAILIHVCCQLASVTYFGNSSFQI